SRQPHPHLTSPPFTTSPTTTPTDINTLSLHDALPICRRGTRRTSPTSRRTSGPRLRSAQDPPPADGPARCSSWRPHMRGRTKARSEEHTSELQSRSDLVCRLLLEKKKQKNKEDKLTHQ